MDFSAGNCMYPGRKRSFVKAALTVLKIRQENWGGVCGKGK